LYPRKQRAYLCTISITAARYPEKIDERERERKSKSKGGTRPTENENIPPVQVQHQQRPEHSTRHKKKQKEQGISAKGQYNIVDPRQMDAVTV
jgi:hypothetical protein